MLARLFLVLLLLAVEVGALLSAFAAESTAPEGASAAGQAPEPKKPRVRVTISKQTTVITEPLYPDGYPDYLEAVNRMASQGVTPQNNAMVLLVKAFGPREIRESIQAEYFKRLGIDPLPEEGEYFVYYKYVTRTAADSLQAPRSVEDEEPLRDEAYRQLDLATTRPWSKADCPLVAGWLEANEKPLRLIVEASGRPRFYSPMPSVAQKNGLLGGAVLGPEISWIAEAGRALVARAHLHISEGKTPQAIEDLLACHRIAHLVGQKPTLIHGVVSRFCEGIACRGDANLAHYGKLTLQQAQRYSEQLRKLPPLPSAVERIDKFERLVAADAICALAHGDVDILWLLSLGWEKTYWTRESLRTIAARMFSDGDLMLRISNEHFDRLVAAGRRPIFSERIKALRDIEKEVQKQYETRAKPLAISAQALKTTSPRKAVSQTAAISLMNLFTPAIRACVEDQERCEMSSDLAQLALALGAYRTDHGRYPAELAALVPKYIAELPKDRYSDGQIKYRQEKDGYVLYSVGLNLNDDNGYGCYVWGQEQAPEDGQPGSEPADDVGIRMPPKLDQ